LEILGYRHLGFDFEALRSVAHGDYESALRKTEEFDGFEDAPWFMLHRELDARYPSCRFVLTVRRDFSQWFRSARGHDSRENSDDSIGAAAKAMFISFYNSRGVDCSNPAAIYEFHNRSVQDYFRGRENKLLTACWEKGDGWKELCRFLGKPVPEATPFPHMNASLKVS
jgi:hypothetical protein